MKLKIHGIIPAVFTPMHPSGELNLEVVDDYVEYLVANGIKDIFVLGTAGEGVNLSVDERKLVLEKWKSSSTDKIPNVIAHVGAGNLKDCIELAQHGAAIGVNAIATMAPYFFKPADVSHLADRIETLAKAVPQMPVLFYHFPVLTDVHLNVKKLFDEMKKRDVKNFAGVKFTSHDLCDFGFCCSEYKNDYTLCYGYDEQAMAGLLLGADSCVGSTFNYCLPLYKRIYEACKSNNVKVAQENQYHSCKLIGSLVDKGFNLGVNKALMQRLSGVEVGPVRAPLESPSAEKMDEIMAMLTEIGFYEWNQKT